MPKNSSVDLEKMENSRKECAGWVSIMVIMLAFPALFYLCVYFPIWMGFTSRW